MQKSTKKITLLIIVTLLIPIVPFVIIGELPGERWLSSTDGNALTFGLTGAGLLASDVLLPIPSSIVGTLLGARLGLVSGLLWATVGMVVGSLIGYLLGRLTLARIGAQMPATPTLMVIFLTRPIPVIAEALTFAAGATQVKFLPFLIVSSAGNFVYALILAANGATLLPQALIGYGLFIPFILPVVTWLGWRWWNKRVAQAHT